MGKQFTSSNFEYIWDKWIVPLADKIYNEMDEDFCRCCDVQLRKTNFDNIKRDACRFFLDKRTSLKSEYYGKDYNKTNSDEHRMDFHKLSAILCRTLIEYKLFDFDVDRCEKHIKKYNIDKTNTDWLIKNSLVNFRMAFYASVVFLYQSMLYVYRNDVVIYNRLKSCQTLDLYNDSKYNEFENKVHESFENCIVLDLAKRDINNRSFDYFMYSTIMYQLEKYNYMLLLQNPKLLT